MWEDGNSQCVWGEGMHGAKSGRVSLDKWPGVSSWRYAVMPCLGTWTSSWAAGMYWSKDSFACYKEHSGSWQSREQWGGGHWNQVDQLLWGCHGLWNGRWWSNLKYWQQEWRVGGIWIYSSVHGVRVFSRKQLWGSETRCSFVGCGRGGSQVCCARGSEIRVRTWLKHFSRSPAVQVNV